MLQEDSCGFDAGPPYAYPIVGFVGTSNGLENYLRSRASVNAIVDMREYDKGQEIHESNFDNVARINWLRETLKRLDVGPRRGFFTVVLNLQTDEEINELRWNARAQVLNVGTRSDDVIAFLPRLRADRPQSFYGKIEACIDPSCFSSEALLA